MVGRVIPINKCTWCMYNVGLHVKCVALPIVVGAWSMVVLSSWHGMMVSSNCRSVIPMLCTMKDGYLQWKEVQCMLHIVSV